MSSAASPRGDAQSRVGQILGEKYRLARIIGQGGMGVVYEAQHVLVGRRFAVKFLQAQLAGRADLVARFRREAQAAGALESEHITQVVDFGHAGDGVPYIVMELLAGEDLAHLLAREGPLAAARAAGVVIQACRGLDTAHAAGIVHRDLKPENLFLCRRADGPELVKILDFGVAKLDAQPAGAATLDGARTRTGSTLGTPFYMSPEQARGEKDLDHRADVYALGVILFEALSGKKPHPGDSHNAIVYHILTQPPASLAALRPDLPPKLVEAVHRALAGRPGDRQPSAIALARELAPFTGKDLPPLRSQFELRAARATATLDGAAATPAVDMEVPKLATTATMLSGPGAPAALRPRRSIAIGAFAAVALVAAGRLVWHHGPHDQTTLPAATTVAPAAPPTHSEPAMRLSTTASTTEATAPIPIPPQRSAPSPPARSRVHHRPLRATLPSLPKPPVQPEPRRRPVFDHSNPY